jgi:transcriptional regulator of met regulon
MTNLRHINNSKLGLVNGAIGTVSNQPQPDEFSLDEEVIDN